jgi:RHS repeat-associated protein
MDRLIERHAFGGGAHAALSRRTWKYDPTGRVAEIADDRWGTTTYQHDSIGQLIGARRRSHHEAFQYDATGSLRNIFRGLKQAGNAQTWDVEAGNRLTRTDKARYEYDARGRRVKKVALVDAEGARAGDVTTHLWDDRDRLREVQKASGERVLFTYDAFGRRVGKEVLPAGGEGERRVVEFLWDGEALAADRDTVRGARVFVHEPGTFVPMLQAEQGQVFAVVNDHLGMPKELIDKDGRTAWSAAHSGWGKVVAEHRDPSKRQERSIESPFRLLGQYADAETGLCCTRFRYFDADVGRWCSPDPLGLLGGRNLCQFNGSPAVEVDPLGLAACIGTKISQKQLRHVENRPEWVNRGQGSYVKSVAEAQAVLDAYHSGNATVLGQTSQGHVVVNYPGVTGYNNNPGAGFANQPTNVFMIKGTSSPSVVPTSPNWTP